MPVRKDPIKYDAISPPTDPAKSAAMIFIHGLDDDAFGVSGIPDQFNRGGKLPHVKWVLPNALHNMDAMASAWYLPVELSRFPSQRPELDDPEDEEGLKQSRGYIEGLIDELVAEGVPAERIVLGGFSQGHALALFTGLTSGKYAGRLGGIVGICGYFPMEDQMDRLREESGLPKTVSGEGQREVLIFVSRGMKDMLIPKRFWNISMERLKQLGYDVESDEKVEKHEYANQSHAIGGEVLRDMCGWAERVIPELS